jgi:GMP synthase-like glutamine amidotransferase
MAYRPSCASSIQEIATTFGGKVEEHTHREYGSAKITVKKTGNALADRLFEGIETGPEGMQVSGGSIVNSRREGYRSSSLQCLAE